MNAFCILKTTDKWKSFTQGNYNRLKQMHHIDNTLKTLEVEEFYVMHEFYKIF